MATIYGSFQTDKGLETDGIYLQYGFLHDDPDKPIRIKIARAGGSNQKFNSRLEAKVKPHRRSIQSDTLDNKVAEKLMMEVFVDTVILGWENVTDTEGNVLPFNRVNALKIFTDLPDLFDDIRVQAGKAALFLQDVLEVDAGN